MDTTVTYRSLRQGEMLNWYRIEKILGHGGFGVIYLATDTNLEHPVAVKEYRALLNPGRPDSRGSDTVELIDQSEQGLQRFIAEARNLVRFKHPNIVRIMSVFEANDTAYMVMEFEEGEDLREYLKDPAHSTESALKALIKPVSQGLAEVHKHGFIHRDIKPANILVRKDGSPVLLDFGSARSAMPFSEDPLTALVSAGYSPLEQYSDKSDEQQGPWTDIYALGAVLYYSITGAEPVDSAKRGSAILNGAHDPLLPARMLGRGRYSDSFLDAIDWALQFRICDRPQSLSDWIPALLQSSNRDTVTRRVEAPTQPASGSSTGPDVIDETRVFAEPGLRASSQQPVEDPLDGFSMRDQPAPREVEAARVKRIGKRGTTTHRRGMIRRYSVRGVLAASISLASIASVFAIWQYRETIAGMFGNHPSELAEVEQTDATLTAVSETATPDADEILLAEQAQAAKIAAQEKALALLRAKQLAEEKLAAQLEQERIDAIAAAAAIATTKQIAAQKKADEAARQAEEAASEKKRREEAAAKLAAEQARQRERRRQFNRQLEQAILQMDEGELNAAEQSLDNAAALSSGDSRLAAARARWRAALDDSRKPVSDADFDQVIAQFDGLRRALESNDASKMTELTEASNQNALFTQLMSRFSRLEITISKIRVRNASKSITATLRIENMVRSNGDRATPSSAYRERTIESQRRESQWSKIRW